MRGFALAGLALAATLLAAAAASAQTPNSKQVQGSGCVQPHSTPACLVVKDMQTGKLYNLQITGAKPSVGIGINFTGVPASGAATCAKGDPVQVTNWTREDSLKCSKGSVE